MKAASSATNVERTLALMLVSSSGRESRRERPRVESSVGLSSWLFANGVRAYD